MRAGKEEVVRMGRRSWGTGRRCGHREDELGHGEQLDAGEELGHARRREELGHGDELGHGEHYNKYANL